ncbi:MAG: hypothetical protein ACI4JK_06880 [Oscillospiraceae bacterium]
MKVTVLIENTTESELDTASSMKKQSGHCTGSAGSEEIRKRLGAYNRSGI